MSHAPEVPDPRRKRLLWRATHRGIKEMDIVFGGFVTAGLARFTDAELCELEVMIEIPDQQLLSWATRQESVPAQQATPLLKAMLSHRP